MRPRTSIIALVSAVAFLVLAGAAGAVDHFGLPLSAVTSGGGVSGDGHFVVAGSIGQPVAGTLTASELRAEVGVIAGGPTTERRLIPALARDP